MKGNLRMNEKVEKIKQLVPIEEYATYLGYHVIRKGSYLSLEEHDSIMINPRTNRYFQNSCCEEHARGSIINFVMHFCKVDYKTAIRDLTNYIGSGYLDDAKLKKPIQSQSKKRMLILPPHGGNRRHVYAYLNKVRCIDKFIIDYFFQSGHLYEDNKKNCVFVSFDEKSNQPDFACRRGTYSDIPFKGDISGCDYKYCFRLPAACGTKLFVCEAVIDLMSLMTILIEQRGKEEMAGYHYQAIAGTDKYMAIFSFLNLHPEIEDVYLALDNDKPGRDACAYICKKAKELKMQQKFHLYLPKGENMDWNKVLVKRRKMD